MFNSRDIYIFILHLQPIIDNEMQRPVLNIIIAFLKIIFQYLFYIPDGFSCFINIIQLPTRKSTCSEPTSTEKDNSIITYTSILILIFSFLSRLSVINKNQKGEINFHISHFYHHNSTRFTVINIFTASPVKDQ